MCRKFHPRWVPDGKRKTLTHDDVSLLKLKALQPITFKYAEGKWRGGCDEGEGKLKVLAYIAGRGRGGVKRKGREGKKGKMKDKIWGKGCGGEGLRDDSIGNTCREYWIFHFF